MHTFRTSKTKKDLDENTWRIYYEDAVLASNDYAYGADESWMWGNVDSDELGNYDLTAIVTMSGDYDYFIVYK
jgi:hypothetical protein